MVPFPIGQSARWSGLLLKSNHLFLLPSWTPSLKFHCNLFITFWIMLLPDRKTNKQTNQCFRKYNFLAKGVIIILKSDFGGQYAFWSARHFSWWPGILITAWAPARVIIKVKSHQEKWRHNLKYILPDQNHVFTIIVACKKNWFKKKRRFHRLFKIAINLWTNITIRSNKYDHTWMCNTWQWATNNLGKSP